MAPVDEGESILEKIQREAGIPLPTWAIGTLSVLLLVGLLTTALKPLWPGVAAVVKAVAKSVQGWYVRRRQDQRRAQGRAQFADYVEGQMRRLGEKEEWRDNRYAELEAEVEVREEGRRRWFFWHSAEVRRLPSLSKALETISHRLVLLEGDPGSGKSVALRHLTQLMCLRLVRRPSEKDPIPLYINLKEFRPAGTTVSAADVRDFVIASINRGRNRDIDRYMDEEFDKGFRDGTWFFLFDSFDEIPAILSATEANETIECYSDALYDFLHGMGSCRGVVASREFRGPPRRYNWPTLRIVPLTWTRKIELIQKANLGATLEQSLIDDLQEAPAELRSLSDNPMFLGLLCEHLRDGNTFPETAHVVTESYVSERFTRDAGRIRDIFAVEPDLVREVSEELAFLIASEQALGLTVERSVVTPLLAAHLGHAEEEIHAGLDALEYTKLARCTEDPTSAVEGTSITFSHRRIQEYFATCVVLRDATRVDTRSLVLDGRWREAAVTVLQVQNESQVREVLAVIAADLVVPPQAEADEPFSWRAHQFHLLELLADGGGYAKYPTGLACLSEKVDAILTAAWESKNRRNQKWTLEVCSAATPDLALRFIREAFEGDSEWLRGEAYTQARRVRQVTAEIEAEIRQTLLDYSISGDLRRSHRSIRAQVCRIANPTDLLHAITLLRVAPMVDCFVLAVLLVPATYHRGLTFTLYLAFFALCGWIFVRTLFVRPDGNRSKWRRSVHWLIGPSYYPNARMRTVRKVALAVVAFLVVLSRAPLVFGVLFLFDRQTAVLASVAALVSGTWLMGALLAVRAGEWLRPARWPLLLGLPVVLAVRAVRRASVADWWKFARILALGVLLSVGGVAVFFGIGMLIASTSFTAALLVLAAFVAAMFVALIGYGVLSYRDRSRSEQIEAVHTVDTSWLVGKIGSLRLATGVASLLRNLRTASPRPPWSGDALDLLNSIGRQAELYRSAENETGRKRADADFKGLLRPHGVAKHPRLRSFATSEVLDEIGKVEDDSYVTR